MPRHASQHLATLALLLAMSVTVPVAAATPPAQGAEPASGPTDAVGGADFDADGFDDLAIGVPLEGLGTSQEVGVVHVLHGSGAGLTATATQLWSQDSPGVDGEGEANDEFGESLAWADFDGDGFDDLAIGAPWEDLGAIPGAGVVHVLYGSGDGLNATGSQMWSQDSPGIEDAPESVDAFGSSLAARDLDDDGKAELVIGAPGEDNATGAIHVLSGSSAGLTATGSQLWRQLRGEPEEGDYFGMSLATGDLDADGHLDLAISAPFEDLGRRRYSGAVNVMYGSATGLRPARNQWWNERSTGLPFQGLRDDLFGTSLAIGHLDDDHTGDLAIGVPNEKGGRREHNAGVVQVLFGVAGEGLTTQGAQLLSQDTPGVLDRTEFSDSFGSALAITDLDDDGFRDLVVGVSGECPAALDCGAAGAGAVAVLRGGANGVTGDGDQLWTQDSPGILDTTELADSFGRVLAYGDYDGNGLPDLAIGAANEDLGAVDAGATNVLYARAGGLGSAGNQFWHQDSPGIPDQVEEFDYFGHALVR